MTYRALVHRISAAAPDDVGGIETAIASGRIDPKGVLAVLAKTEGNGLVNDFSRGHATLALPAVRAPPAGERRQANLPGHVRRHRGRHGAALAGVRARRRRARQGPVARHRSRPYAAAAVRASRTPGTGRSGGGWRARR